MNTILIVDDNPVMRRMLSYTLQKNGYTALTAGNGREALHCLATEPVDLLLCDLAMPEMDGLAVLRQLRADVTFAALPIIMLTASGQDEDRVLARNAGASHFLTKPTSSSELLDTVRQFLG